MIKATRPNLSLVLLALQCQALATPPAPVTEVVAPVAEAALVQAVRSPLGQLLERAGVRVILLESREGRMLIRNVLDRPRLTDLEITAEVYGEFATALESPTFQQLRAHLEPKLIAAHEEFLTARRLNESTSYRGNEVPELTAEELAASRELRTAASRFVRAIDERAQILAAESNIVFIPRFSGGPTTAAEALSITGRFAEAEGSRVLDGLVPTLPLNVRTGIQEMERAKLNFFQAIGLRYRAFRGFFEALKINPVTWWNTFRRPTPQWTLEDLKLIRKYNRMLDGLNEYARFHLVMQAFSHERPQIYSMLNEATKEATAAYMSGQISREAYLAKRVEAAGKEDTFGAVTRRVIERLAPFSAHSRNSARAAAGATAESAASRGAVPEMLLRETSTEEELLGRLARGQQYFEINEIWKEAERRMLETIEKLHELGGGTHAGVHYESMIEIERANFSRTAQELTAAQASLRTAESNLAAMTLAQRVQERERYRTLVAELMRARVQKDRILSIHDQNASKLDDVYAQFASRYETLELFVNIHRGRIGPERVQRMDLPEAFDVATETIRGWTPIYEVARVQSLNAEIISEVRVFTGARFGSARTFINDLNRWTSKYFNKRFTETAAGREFMGLADSLAKVILKRGTLITGGIASAVGLTDEEAREAAIRVMRNSWAEVFGTNEQLPPPSTPTGTTPPVATPPGASATTPTAPTPATDLPPLPPRRGRPTPPAP